MLGHCVSEICTDLAARVTANYFLSQAQNFKHVLLPHPFCPPLVQKAKGGKVGILRWQLERQVPPPPRRLWFRGLRLKVGPVLATLHSKFKDSEANLEQGKESNLNDPFPGQCGLRGLLSRTGAGDPMHCLPRPSCGEMKFRGHMRVGLAVLRRSGC